MLKVTKIENTKGKFQEGRVNFLLNLCIDSNLCAFSLDDTQSSPRENSRNSLAVRTSNWLGQLNVAELFGTESQVRPNFYLVHAMSNIAAYNRSGRTQSLSLEQPEIDAQSDNVSWFAVINKVSGEFIGQVQFCENGPESQLEPECLTGFQCATQETLLEAIAECHKLFAINQELR